MKHKKHILILALLMTTLFMTGGRAQNQTSVHDDGVAVSVSRLAQQGAELNLDAEFTLLRNLRTGKRLDLTPVLRNGADSLLLEPITFLGKNKLKEHRRHIALRSKKQAAREGDVQVFPGYGKGTHRATYHATVPYAAWMEGAHLSVMGELCDCGDGLSLTTNDVVANHVELEQPAAAYVVKPHFAYLKPKAEGVKKREVAENAYLNFKVNKWDILPDFGNNPTELAKIRELVEKISGGMGVDIRQVDILGYASPEGSLQRNRLLSENRARSMVDYLRQRYDIPTTAYSIHFGGEDWNGLAELVKKDATLSNKEEVLNIIYAAGNEQTRKQRLQQLAGGEPYRYMLQELYPHLRRVFVKVQYDVRDFTTEEAVRVFREQPQNLSLQEMYAVAGSYQEGSQDFIDVFETAVRLYPKDPVANLNAAVSALQRNDLVSAERYLQRVEGAERQSSQYHNATGILHLLQGDTRAARQAFERAGTLHEALENIKETEQAEK